MVITHTTVKAPGQTLAAVADWNAAHAGTAAPAEHGNEAHNPDFADTTTYNAHDHSIGDPTQISHANLTNVTSDQHHAQSHTLASHSTKAHTELTDVTSDQHHAQSHNAASHSDITSSGADIDDAVSKKHSANADTALGSDCVALDHVTPATDTVGNYCYGTGDPPAANTTTEGALFIKYTA